MGKGVTKTVPQIFRDNICTAFNLLNAIIAIVLVMVGAWKNILFIFAILINTTIIIEKDISTFEWIIYGVLLLGGIIVCLSALFIKKHKK